MVEWVQWVLLGGIFTVVTGVTFISYLWILGRKNSYRQRLEALEDDDNPFSGGEEPLVLGDLTQALAGQSPLTEGKRKAVEQELREAGFYSPNALMEYSAIRAFLILIPLFIAGAAAMFLEGMAMLNIGIAGIMFALLGYSVPRVYLGYLARQRCRKIERGLPVAVDLLSLGLTGGQNIMNSMTRVTHELRISNDVLADELRIVREQAEIGNLELAMMQFANRTNIPEVRTLALVLAQSERLGTDIAQTLMEFSSNYRNTMRQRAESQANRASFWMLFPTVLCLWIPSLVILFGPVYHEFYRHGQESKEALQKGLNNLSGVNDSLRQGTSFEVPAPAFKNKKE
jgi:tight adherence protein C